MGRSLTSQEKRRLTPRQLEILTMIRDYQKIHGCSPTMQELAEPLGVTKVTVFEHVERLVDKGYLRRLPHKARSLELTARVELPDEKYTSLPIVGHIAAGAPIEAVENRERLDIDAFFNSRHGTFVLRVRGDSMKDEGICDGDYVICEQRSEARQGETVVALLESGEATLKKYYKQDGKIKLQPANSDYEPIFVDQIQIQGVLRGVLRLYS